MEAIWLLVVTIAILLSCVGAYVLGVRNGRAGTGAVSAGARAAGMILFLVFAVQLYGIVGVLLVAVVPALYLAGWFRARELLMDSADTKSTA